jgi:hypothetical protein
VGVTLGLGLGTVLIDFMAENSTELEKTAWCIALYKEQKKVTGCVM